MPLRTDSIEHRSGARDGAPVGAMRVGGFAMTKSITIAMPAPGRSRAS
jgi:hypothetical protein